MLLIEINSISNMGRQKKKLSHLLDIPATWQAHHVFVKYIAGILDKFYILKPHVANWI